MNASRVPARESIVIYDADCGFCKWSLALLLRADRDRLLRPVALGAPEADALLADLDPQERLASWHLVTPDGRRASAGAGLSVLVALLPGGRGPAAALARMPALTDRGYRWVAEHRSALSRTIPSAAKRRATELIAERERRRS